MRQCWQHADNLETEDSAMLRLVSWQKHLFPHCFGTFAIGSFFLFLFHFVLSQKKSENSFNIAFRKRVRAHTLRKKYKPCFELPENSMLKTTQSAIQKLTLWRREVMRHVHVLLKTQTWANRNRSRNIYDHFRCASSSLYFCILLIEVYKIHPNYTNRSVTEYNNMLPA